MIPLIRALLAVGLTVAGVAGGLLALILHSPQGGLLCLVLCESAALLIMPTID